MGIYLPNMEMPRRGMVVNIYGDGRVTNHFDEFGKTIGKAVPVPPHGDLIDRDELIENGELVNENTGFYSLQGISMESINIARTIIKAEQ